MNFTVSPTNNIHKHIAGYIRIERLKMGYSQEYLSLQLGISQNAYSRIERGVTKLDIERLLEIIILLKMDVDALLSSVFHEYSIDRLVP